MGAPSCPRCDEVAHPGARTCLKCGATLPGRALVREPPAPDADEDGDSDVHTSWAEAVAHLERAERAARGVKVDVEAEDDSERAEPAEDDPLHDADLPAVISTLPMAAALAPARSGTPRDDRPRGSGTSARRSAIEHTERFGTATRPTPPADVPVPTITAGDLIVPPYVAVRALGAGGMGSVWLAEHQVTGHRVAIKLLRATGDDREEAAARLVDEARALARVDHRGIVPLLGFERRDDGWDALIMKAVEGESLEARLDAQGHLSPETVRRLGLDLLEALGHLHARDIVHRDVKPANILLEDDGHPVLVDFGIARHLGGGQRLTRQGVIVGTPHYVSPEQACGETLDPRSDLYAVGAVLFEAATGAPPYRGKAARVIRGHLAGDIPDASEAGVPAALAAFLTHLLAKDPEDRPGSAEEARQELLGVALSSAVDDAAEGAPAVPPPPVAPARPDGGDHEVDDGAADEDEDEDDDDLLYGTRRPLQNALMVGAAVLLASLLALPWLAADTPALADGEPPTTPTSARPADGPTTDAKPASQTDAPDTPADPQLSDRRKVADGSEAKPEADTSPASDDGPAARRRRAPRPRHRDRPAKEHTKERAKEVTVKNAPRTPPKGETAPSASAKEAARAVSPPEHSPQAIGAALAGDGGRSAIQRCYADWVSASSDGPPGVIALKGVLGEEGRVAEVDVVRQTVGGGRFRICVLKAAGAWRSPIGRIGARFLLTVALRPSAAAG